MRFFLTATTHTGRLTHLEEHSNPLKAWRRFKNFRGVFELRREELRLYLYWRGEVMLLA